MTHETVSLHVIDNGTAPTAQVISLGELHAEARTLAEPQAPLVRTNPLHALRARLEVRVGEVALTVGELMQAREHQVLVLDRTLDDAVDLLLQGQVVARGELVAMEGRFALRITELPVPLKP
jgi:flagellar motor switch protein FliN/FliY